MYKKTLANGMYVSIKASTTPLPGILTETKIIICDAYSNHKIAEAEVLWFEYGEINKKNKNFLRRSGWEMYADAASILLGMKQKKQLKKGKLYAVITWLYVEQQYRNQHMMASIISEFMQHAESLILRYTPIRYEKTMGYTGLPAAMEELRSQMFHNLDLLLSYGWDKVSARDISMRNHFVKYC